MFFQPRSEDVLVSYRGQLAENIYPEMGFRTPVGFKGSTSPADHNLLNKAPVTFLDKMELFPPGFLAGIPQGSREFFSNQAGLRYVILQTCLLLIRSSMSDIAKEAP